MLERGLSPITLTATNHCKVVAEPGRSGRRMSRLTRSLRAATPSYTLSEWFEAVSEALRQPINDTEKFIGFSRRVGLQIPLVQAGRRAARSLLGAKTPVAVHIELGSTPVVKIEHLPDLHSPISLT